jgi:hypothetical protein
LNQRQQGDGNGAGSAAEAAEGARQAEDQQRNKRILTMAEDRIAEAGERILTGDATLVECAAFVGLVRLTSMSGALDYLAQLHTQRLPDPSAAQVARLIRPG